MVSKKVIVIIGVILLGAYLGLMPSSPSGIDKAYVGVMYDNPWQGAIGDLGTMNSWGAQESYVQLFNRPQDTSFWIISANAQKMDDSSDTLTIMIWYTDDNGDPVTLIEASTSVAYGVAQVSCEIKKP